MGLKKAHPDKRIGVVWIDAHADLHTPFTTPSGNMHGMPLAMCLAINNEEEKVNEPDEAVKLKWNEIKKIGGVDPKLNSQDIVFIALRDTEKPEEALIEKHHMKVFRVKEVSERGEQAIVNDSLDYLSACDLVYVSFDVDSMDTSISVGTGTPVPDGLSLDQAVRLNQLFMDSGKVDCWEMVEVNPTLDTENAMANAAFKVLEAVLTNKS